MFQVDPEKAEFDIVSVAEQEFSPRRKKQVRQLLFS
jgi:hypothetical protein